MNPLKNRQSGRRWAGLAVALLAGVVLAAVALPVQAQDRPDVVVAVNQLARGLEPATRTGNVDIRTTYSIFDTLIRRDFLNPLPDGGVRLVPALATSWKRVDSRTLDLELRHGVKFHNGDEFTADDVLMTFNPDRLWGPKSAIANGRSYFGHLERVEKLGTYAVRFITKEPDLIFEQRLATYTSWIINANFWKKFEASGKADWAKDAGKAATWEPIGTGPYKFDSWKKSEFIKLVAHDDYWMGKPAAKSITFREVPEVATRIAGLVSGEFDIIVNVPPDQVPVLERYDDIEVRDVVLENTHVIVFNTNNPVVGDKRLRQALSLAIDRDLLRKTLWRNKTVTPNGHQMPFFGEMYNKNRPGYLYDPERAKALLKEAGYTGQTLEFRFIPDYYLQGTEVVQAVQEMWRKVGVNVELSPKENFDAMRTPEAQMYTWSNSYRLPDPTGGVYILYGPKSAIQTESKYWYNEDFNRLSEEVLTGGDMKERYTKFQQSLDIFEDDMPMTMLYNPLESYGVKKRIQWTPYELYFMDFRPDVLKVR